MLNWCAAGIGLVQLVGQFAGSTTFTGACVYEGVTLAWWGFLPLNVGGLIVSTYTLRGVL